MADIRAAPSLGQSLRQFYRLLILVRPFWRGIGGGALLGVVVGTLGMATPYLAKLLIDRVYPARDVTLMYVIVASIFALTLSGAVIGAVRAYYGHYVTARLASATSLMFFNHVQHLQARFFDEHRVGEITSRFSDVTNSLAMVSRVLDTVIANLIYLALVPPFLLLLEWRLALVSIVAVPVTVVITTLSGRLLRRYWQRVAEAAANLNAFQVETFSHMRTLKAMAAEPDVFERSRGYVEQSFRSQLKAGVLSQIVAVLNATVTGAGTLVFSSLGWRLILAQRMSLGDYIAFMAYVGYLYAPLAAITNLIGDFQQSAVYLNRMFEYLDEPPEQDPVAVYGPLPTLQRRIRGEFRLERVNFSYQDGRPVLRDVTLHLPAGSVTALIGLSGAGKSSLLRLLCRFATPDSGQITLDGASLSQIRLSDLRRQTAVVWQEPSLLQGTVWDNLTLGSSAPTREAVDRAVQICQLDEVIAKLAGGYQTPVAEWGATLSGGQRQRIAIARAILRDAPVLLLDEPTSNIDMQTESQLLSALIGHYSGRTVVWITHRVSTARLADQICLLDTGQVVGCAPHDELSSKSDAYRKLLAWADTPVDAAIDLSRGERRHTPRAARA